MKEQENEHFYLPPTTPKYLLCHLLKDIHDETQQS